MAATVGELPATDDWAFEPKWGGLRTLLVNEPGLVTLSDAHGNDVTAAFPDVRRVGRALGSAEVILDGVITTAAGADSVQRRLAAKSDSTIRKIAKDQPAVFVAFDLLWHEGHSCCDEPWTDRRARLDDLELNGDNWRAPNAHVGDGAELADAGRAQGVEALVAKRVASSYDPGSVSADWLVVTL
ncbi:MAG TPA: hypothetical protein VFV00_16545 [Acidimicrobiales bacterium]|nr:hypothetical protein [Acidimicrobiales bacterium]